MFHFLKMFACFLKTFMKLLYSLSTTNMYLLTCLSSCFSYCTDFIKVGLAVKRFSLFKEKKH